MFGVLIANAWSADNPAHIEEYIYYVAGKEKVDITKALAIAKCESRLRKDVIRDSKNDLTKTSDDEYSVGIFQINLIAHKTVTKEQALNPFFNINLAIDQLAKENWGMWKNCYEKIKVMI